MQGRGRAISGPTIRGLLAVFGPCPFLYAPYRVTASHEADGCDPRSFIILPKLHLVPPTNACARSCPRACPSGLETAHTAKKNHNTPCESSSLPRIAAARGKPVGEDASRPLESRPYAKAHLITTHTCGAFITQRHNQINSTCNEDVPTPQCSLPTPLNPTKEWRRKQQHCPPGARFKQNSARAEAVSRRANSTAGWQQQNKWSGGMN